MHVCIEYILLSEHNRSYWMRAVEFGQCCIIISQLPGGERERRRITPDKVVLRLLGAGQSLNHRLKLSNSSSPSRVPNTLSPQHSTPSVRTSTDGPSRWMMRRFYGPSPRRKTPNQCSPPPLLEHFWLNRRQIDLSRLSMVHHQSVGRARASPPVLLLSKMWPASLCPLPVLSPCVVSLSVLSLILVSFSFSCATFIVVARRRLCFLAYVLVVFGQLMSGRRR